MKAEQFAYQKGYRAQKDGEVIGSSGQKLKLSTNRYGYLYFSVRNGSKCIKIKVHRMVAYQKYGQKLYEEGIETRHVNNIKDDNHWDNILIGTHSENMMDIPRKERVAAAKHASSFQKKYDYSKVREFHEENGRSYKRTMKEFDIPSKGSLHHILN